MAQVWWSTSSVWWTLALLCLTISVSIREIQSVVISKNRNNKISTIIKTRPLRTRDSSKIAVLWHSGGTDKEFQVELLKSVFVALRDLENHDINPDFVDVAKSPGGMSPVAEWVWNNGTTAVVSLLRQEHLSQFLHFYDKINSESRRSGGELKVFTPRTTHHHHSRMKGPPSVVSVYSLQMSAMASCVAILHRVERVGITTLIPILDSESSLDQLRLLNYLRKSGEERLKKIAFTQPIFLNVPSNFSSFLAVLGEDKSSLVQRHGWTRVSSSSGDMGFMLLATQGARTVMKLAEEKKHLQMGWFSPEVLEHEEWTYPGGNSSSNGGQGQGTTNPPNNNVDGDEVTQPVSPFFGLYTLSFVGSTGWDSPDRRRVLRELVTFTGASPRIFSSVLAYDCGWLAVNYLRRGQLDLPMVGMSGQIGFDAFGYRRDGIYFGVSAVPTPASHSSIVTLLQPSTWILEDKITIIETMEGQFLIKDYEVATSFLLTGPELKALAKKVRTEKGCGEHVMNLITYDPFNQMPYNYYFKEANLPENLLIPNQHGFGITFLCVHDDSGQTNNNATSNNSSNNDDRFTTTIQIACTPGARSTEPIQCFRSTSSRSSKSTRQKRSSVRDNNGGGGPIPSQYQYNFGGNDYYYPQNSKWSDPKDDASSDYYFQHHFQPGTTSYPQYPQYRRQDTSVSAAAEMPTTVAPAPPPAPPATSKLPELRQILKAAKPFVGSCIGSTTGCAMCVLVLGRLPLGAVPAACTGPCFVGTFGSCGSLLGRVFSETTVICTELFRQGRMDQETFFADVEFGRFISQQFPTTMEGYTLLATPVVRMMRKSEAVSDIVSYFAVPWAHHMKFIMGRTNEPNVAGLIIHTIGFPLCNLAGHIYTAFQFRGQEINWTTLLLTLTLIIVALTETLYHPGKKAKSRPSFLQRLQNKLNLNLACLFKNTYS